MKQNQSTWQIFLVVLFSVLSALIIGTALSSIDYGGNPSISTYIGMFLAQFFIVVPVILLLKRNNLNIAKSLRINRVSKKILLYSFILSIGADYNKGKDINDISNPKNWALVMGSEASGISKTMNEKISSYVKIERFGKGESLNIGVAMGIVLHRFTN